MPSKMRGDALTPATLALGLGAALLLTYFLHFQPRRKVIRRAAFDIGSGASKVLVADVDVASGALVGDVLFEAEKPLPFKVDAQASADGSLSDDIRLKGFALLEKLASEARLHGAVEACGIATEIFRTSPNGLNFLTQVENRTRVPISTLTQDAEARLGLATAEALTGGSWHASGAWVGGGVQAGHSDKVLIFEDAVLP